ncbi:hypothetical protein LA080_003595 [Diaporthe eres]|nr:hypothetical protein LA080_003595 [Diaporthe eres]
MADWPRPRRSRQPHRELNNFQQGVNEPRRLDVDQHTPFVEELDHDDGEPYESVYAAEGLVIHESQGPHPNDTVREGQVRVWSRWNDRVYDLPKGDHEVGQHGTEVLGRSNDFVCPVRLLENRCIQPARHRPSQTRETSPPSPTPQKPYPFQQKQRHQHSERIGANRNSVPFSLIRLSQSSTASHLAMRINRISPTLDLLQEMRTAVLRRERRAGHQAQHPAPQGGSNPVGAPAIERLTAVGQRGAQPWVREESVRRQWIEGPEHPVSMLERAGTIGRNGRPSLFQMRGNGEVRIRTKFWQSMTARQRRRWNERGRHQFSNHETGLPPADIQEAIANHQSFIDYRRDICLAQAERMQRRMNGPNLRSRGNGRSAVKTHNVPR